MVVLSHKGLTDLIPSKTIVAFLTACLLCLMITRSFYEQNNLQENKVTTFIFDHLTKSVEDSRFTQSLTKMRPFLWT